MEPPNKIYIKWIPDYLSDDSDGFFIAHTHPFDGATEYRKFPHPTVKELTDAAYGQLSPGSAPDQRNND